jgi:hypothetical protein
LSLLTYYVSSQCATEYAMKRPKTILPRKTPAKTDKKYPTFIVITVIILVISLAAYLDESVVNTNNI